MKEKVYLINKVSINDGLIETDTDIFRTEEERDREWNRVVLSHNNSIIETYDIDLNHIPKIYFYDWNDESLEFLDQTEPDMQHDYFVKSEATIEVRDETH